MFHLSNEDICLACNFAEQFWISGKTGHLELIRLKLSLEEMLLNYQAHLGRDTEFSLKYKKMFGHRQVLVFLPGSRYDPFSCDEDEDQALLRRLTGNSSGTYKWSYKDGVNIIYFEPPKKRLLSSSSAALSTNLKVCENSFGIDKKLVSFGVPVGQTLFRPGESMRYVLLGFIMAEMYDVPITISWLVILVFISFLMSVSTPPVAGGATVCLAIMFRQLGIPDDAIGFAIAINMILGFLLTAVSLYCLQMELIRLGGTLDLLDLRILRERNP